MELLLDDDLMELVKNKLKNTTTRLDFRYLPKEFILKSSNDSILVELLGIHYTFYTESMKLEKYYPYIKINDKCSKIYFKVKE